MNTEIPESLQNAVVVVCSANDMMYTWVATNLEEARKLVKENLEFAYGVENADTSKLDVNANPIEFSPGIKYMCELALWVGLD